MNNITSATAVLVSSMIDIMSIEDLFCVGHFNGPIYNPDSISFNNDYMGCICNCCHGCAKDKEK